MTVQLAQQATDATGDVYLLWGLILLAVGIGLFLVEFLIPSGGLIGLVSGVAIVGSLVAFFRYDTLFGTVALVLYLILIPIALYAMFKLWLNSPLAKGMILGGLDPEESSEEASIAAEQARTTQMGQLRDLIGSEGVAITDLRPVGTVRINGERVDAMAQDSIIDAGTPVIVTDAYDNQIKVRPR